MNLWEETIWDLEQNKRSWLDVKNIGSNLGYITKEEFEQIAKRTEYDFGHGAPKIPVDLIIEGADFKMLRREYDGAEWWEFIDFENQVNKKNKLKIKYLSADDINEIGWVSLEDFIGKGV